MRNLKSVVQRMIDEIPDEVPIGQDLKLSQDLKNLQKNIAYSAPEIMNHWWIELAIIISRLPQEYSNLLPWQKKVVNIFSGKTEL